MKKEKNQLKIQMLKNACANIACAAEDGEVRVLADLVYQLAAVCEDIQDDMLVGKPLKG